MKLRKTVIRILSAAMIVVLTGCGAAPREGTEEESASATESEARTEAPSETAAESTEETEPQETPAPLPAPTVALKDVFAAHGVKCGTCISTTEIKFTSLSRVLLTHFNSVTMGNAMKPDYILNQRTSRETGTLTVEFNNDMLKMLKWARENGMVLRGHTIVWHSQTPEWIFHEEFDAEKPLVGREEMLRRLEDMTRQIFGNLTELGYIDLFYAYDVVNEAFMEDGTMRESRWLETIGEDYLLNAFRLADKYAPERVALFYNDYNEQYKADTIAEFVKTLVDENGRSLIDGIGLQAHLFTKDDLETYLKGVDRLSETGLLLEITELDIGLGAYKDALPATEENLRKQGRFYYDLLNGIFERIDRGTLKMDSVTIWGFADQYSWRREYSPLLFDGKLDPKYAFYGAAQVKEYSGFGE